MSKNPCNECLVKPCCNEPCKELNKFLLIIDKKSTFMSFFPLVFFSIISFSGSIISNYYKINISIYLAFLIITLGLLIATGLYIESIKEFIKKQLMKR
jgi:hypothetical protein